MVGVIIAIKIVISKQKYLRETWQGTKMIDMNSKSVKKFQTQVDICYKIEETEGFRVHFQLLSMNCI